MERDAHLQSLLQHISPWVNEPPSRLSSRAPSERDACPLSPLLCILPDLQQKGASLPGFCNSSGRERCYISGALLQLFLKIPC
jgi:hypothetical protein